METENQDSKPTGPTSLKAVIQKSLKEVSEPFVNMFKVSQAMWGINVPYFLEGLVYFGVLTLLTKFFNEDLSLTDQHAGWVVGAFTGGITLAMFFLGNLADKFGVRKALIFSFIMLVAGRIFLAFSGTPYTAGGVWSSMFFVSTFGLLLVAIGYGMYMPAAYLGVKLFTTPKTAGVAYAMIYGLMNLGSFVSGIISPPIRQHFDVLMYVRKFDSSSFLKVDLDITIFLPQFDVTVFQYKSGIPMVYWVYVGITVLALLMTILLLSHGAIQKVKAEKAAGEDPKKEAALNEVSVKAAPSKDTPKAPLWERIKAYILEHPFRDLRFTFFIFILIPVQTLFAHQWLTLPLYIDRTYSDSVIGQNFEFFSNLNPILIFILAPTIAALTLKANVYKMMIYGTIVMALPTFFLAIGPYPVLLFAYIILMTIGEAMWQPRFLQLIAEIAPEGKTGLYMGIGQFPWFLTKLVTATYSGWFLQSYCPKGGPFNTGFMWLIYGLIAIISPIFLYIAKDWVGGYLEKQPGKK